MTPETPDRNVHMSPELMAEWATRDASGRLLTWEWGEPDEEGFYTPTITTVDDGKRLVDVATVADAERWQAAEAEGHIVDFTETGYGLQHPPSCRPNLIGCAFNEYLADADGPDREPGRYSMSRDMDYSPVYLPLPSEPLP